MHGLAGAGVPTPRVCSTGDDGTAERVAKTTAVS